MATYTFDKIEYGGNIYVVNDSGALQLTGGQVTGPVTFGDSITVDEATLGDLVVNGNASFTNNIQANTINGVTVGSSPQFTDTNTEVSTLTLAAGSTAGTSLTHGGKFTLTAGSKTVSFTMPSDNNTTYTFANGTNGFTVTPSGGSAQTVTVTPSIANNLTGTKTTATLSTTWSSNQQSVTVSGVTASNTVIVTPAPASYDAYCEAGIYCSAQAANSLTFKCDTAPSASLTVNIMIIN